MVTQELAKFVEDVEFAKLPKEMVTKAKNCVLDDPNTKFENEEKCGEGFKCADLGDQQPFLRCLKKCTPSLTANPCPAKSKTACNPTSARFTDTGEAVCFYLACEKNEDCPVYAVKACGATPECSSVGADAFCDVDAQTCARPGNCTPGGLCGPRGFSGPWNCAGATVADRGGGPTSEGSKSS